MNDDALIEAMARALAKRRYAHVGGAEGRVLVAGTPNWHFCRDDALTALTAYREYQEVF